MKKTLSSAALIATLFLTGCSQTGASSGQAEPAPENNTSAAAETTEAATEETTEAATEETTEAAAEGDSTNATEGAVAFGETWTYDDGVTVTVTPVMPVTGSDGAGTEGTGGEYWIFDVVMTNGSEEIFDPVSFNESVQYGAAGLQAERVFDSANIELGSSYGFEGKILPGKSQTLRMGYAIPVAEAADVTMIVSPSYDHVDAIYTGPIG